MVEVACVIAKDNTVLWWHEPEGRTSVSIPDKRDLWDILWENRDNIKGVAHTHPGYGLPMYSSEDYGTFKSVEAGLGRVLCWWIYTGDQGALFRRNGESYSGVIAVEEPWVAELRRRSNF